MQKHDTLRTMLTDAMDEDSVPMQTYAEPLTVSVLVREFESQAQPAAKAWMQQRFVEPFELIEQRLFCYERSI